MDKIKISAVSYWNTFPFLYGLERSEFIKEHAEFTLDIPSVCADKLISGKADLGLIPVAAIPKLPNAQIVSDYCIGATGKVDSVLLVSEVPLPKITKIMLDYQSRTSVNLVRVLAQNYWNIALDWLPAKVGYENEIHGTKAAVIIGDRTFRLEREYAYKYDLADEWFKFTGQPFVFAAWVATKPLSSKFLEQFNLALKMGVGNMQNVVKTFVGNTSLTEKQLSDYLNYNIDYHFTSDKHEAMRLFHKYIASF